MKYIIIDDNQNFVKALCVQLLKEANENINGKTSNEKPLQIKQGEETITIDFTKHNVAQIADAFGNEEKKLPNDTVILINVNLKTDNSNRQDQKGIELLTWLRIKGIMNHVVLYSFESFQTILQRKPENLIAITKGTQYVRLPFSNLEAIIKNNSKAEKKNLQLFLNEIYTASLNHTKTNEFYINNVWKPIIEKKNESASSAPNTLLYEVSKFITDDIADKTESDIDKLITEINEFGMKDLKISLALCDDYAYIQIVQIDNTIYTKKYIIEKTIEQLFPKLKDIFIVNSFSSIDALLQTIENSKCCDIILLDFDLGEDSNGGNIKGTKYFDERKGKKDKHQFLDKNWVLPISYMSDEMIKDFRSNGVTFTQNDLVLSMGADPITKPYLFLFELLSIVIQQLDLALSWSIEFENGYKKKIQQFIVELKTLQDDRYIDNNRSKWIKEFTEASIIFNRIQIIYDYKKRAGLYQSLYSKLEDLKDEIKILELYKDLLYQVAYIDYKDNEMLAILLTDLQNCLNRK